MKLFKLLKPMISFRPMLAATLEDPLTLRLPVLVSDKEDGIRCCLMESHKTGKRIAYSRTLKPIPNLHIRNTLEASGLPLGIDGELVVGANFQETASAVMSVADKPIFKYRVFDWFGDGTYQTFVERFAKLKALCNLYKDYSWLELLPHTLISTLDELNSYETDALARGKEGVMIRSLNGQYKFGRSTLSQQWLLKLKRFIDADATVIGFTELLHNDNDATTNALGQTERSSHQDAKVPGNMLGALVCRHSDQRTIFNIGTGFTLKERWHIWANRELFLHKTVTYKYQHFGVKNAPRAPVFLRWKLDATI
jgi:DNA ligase 1